MIGTRMRKAWQLIRETVSESLNDNVMRLSAALSYYAVFSLAPLLLIAIAVAGAVFSEQAASGLVASELEASIGRTASEAVQEMLVRSQTNADNIVATIVGIVMMIFGAGGVFYQLQDALNTVWGLTAKPGLGIRGMLRDRAVSFSMVLGVGFLLLVSLVLTTTLQAMNSMISEMIPLHPVFWSIVGSVISFAVVTLLFAAIFQVLPDAEVAWRDVWLGAIVTAALFTIAKFGLSWYLSREATSSTYGPAGALVLIMLWVYFSSIILLVGAEFTQVFARSRGHGIKPSPHAVRVDRSERILQEGNKPVLK